MGRFDDALADCNAALAKTPNSVYALTSRGNAYLGKGNLDAALNDYNQVLRINPNYVRAYVGRGQLFEKRRNLAAARADYRAAASAVAGAGVDDIDTTLARAVAKERLEALLGAVAPPPAGKASPSAPQPVRDAQGGADRRQRRLQERRAAGQPAARRQADRVDLSRTRLCHGDAGARSHPG